MASALISLAKYSSVAVTAGCSCGGACLATHSKWNQVHTLEKGVSVQLGGELKKSIYSKANSCIEAEKTELRQFMDGRFREQSQFGKYTTSRYSGCLTDVSFDDALQKLFGNIEK